MIAYLNEENKYTEAVLDDTKELQVGMGQGKGGKSEAGRGKEGRSQ